MPFRSPKMYSFIFGFHRLTWCPKWTPASSSSFIVTVTNRSSLTNALVYVLTGPCSRVPGEDSCEPLQQDCPTETTNCEDRQWIRTDFGFVRSRIRRKT